MKHLAAPIPIPAFPLKGKVQISGVSIGKWNYKLLRDFFADVDQILKEIEK